MDCKKADKRNVDVFKSTNIWRLTMDWKNTIDEMVLGLAMMVIAVFAIIKLGSESVAIVTPAITAYGMYLTNRKKPNGE